MPRIHSLDLIRGIALLGILLMNVQTFSLFAFLEPEQVYALRLDKPGYYEPQQFLINLFVKGQFYTIYSFLFGIGFYLMWNKNMQKGMDANHLFKRRLIFLLVVGLIHALLIWFGDVLHKYALLGFSLLYFNRKTVPVLFKWIAVLAVFVIAFQIIRTLAFLPSPEEEALSQIAVQKVIMNVIDTWQHGSPVQVFQLQKLGVVMLYFMGFSSGMAGFVHFEIMFLLGLIVGKLNILEKIDKILLQRVLFWLILPALALKAVSCLPIIHRHLLPGSYEAYEKLIISLSGFIAVPLLSLVYLCGITLVSRQKPLSGLTRWVANAGRMGLTNYLMQTLILSLLFYGYGAGLAGKLNLSESLLVALGIYIVQVIYSNLWLKHKASGPMETLWRRWTYGRSG